MCETGSGDVLNVKRRGAESDGEDQVCTWVAVDGGHRWGDAGQRDRDSGRGKMLCSAMRRRRCDPCGEATDMVCFAEEYVMINCGCRADYGGAGAATAVRRAAGLSFWNWKKISFGERERAF